MPNWGGLNNALFSWRNGLNALLPERSTRSDGARADTNHASTSQHQADADGTVDAFDEDRNYLGSSDEDGNAIEDRIHAALNKDFMADSRAHLIISDRKIYNDQIGNWRERAYSGSSPHDHHTHRQVHQSLEDDGRPWKFTHTKALLEEINMPTPAEYAQAVVNKMAADLGNENSTLYDNLGNAVWYKSVILPPKEGEKEGKRVSMATIMRWLDAAELGTREEVLKAIAALGEKVDALNPPDTGTA